MTQFYQSPHGPKEEPLFYGMLLIGVFSLRFMEKEYEVFLANIQVDTYAYRAVSLKGPNVEHIGSTLFPSGATPKTVVDGSVKVTLC